MNMAQRRLLPRISLNHRD